MAHTHETRTRAVAMYATGITADEVGAELDVAPTTVIRWVRESGGKVRPRNPTAVETEFTGRWVRDGLIWLAA